MNNNHRVDVRSGRHGSSETLRYRAYCSCGWIGGICSHHKTAEADGDDHITYMVSIGDEGGDDA